MANIFEQMVINALTAVQDGVELIYQSFGGNVTNPIPIVPVTSLTFTDFTKIDHLLTDTENTINSVIGGKIFQSTSTITSAINNTQNNILNKISNGDIAITNSLNNAKNEINNKILGATQAIEVDINNARDKVLFNLNTSTNSINNNITLLKSSLTGVINTALGSSSDSIEAQTMAIKQSFLALITQLKIMPHDTAIEFVNYAIEQKLFDLSAITENETFTSQLGGIGDILTGLRFLLTGSGLDDAIDRGRVKLGNIFNKILSNEYNSLNELKEDLQGINVNGNLFTGLLLTIILFFSVRDLSQAIITPFLKNINYLANDAANSTMLGIGDYAKLKEISPNQTNEANLKMHKLGLSDEDIRNIGILSHTKFSVTEIRDLYWKEIMNENDVKFYLERLGFTNQQTSMIIEAFTSVPPPQDVIRFAVREAFSDDAVREFGLDKYYPDLLTDYAKKWGITKEVAQYYWRSHWSLPSLTQGFEMFHRQVISMEQLQALMRAQDIVPQWQEYLTEISYNPITRVDVRRIHEMGIISDEELVKAYRDIGYSPENAEIMKQWTIQYNAGGGDVGLENTRSLTRSLIIRGFKAGMITKIEAIDRLIDTGYNRENAEFIIELEVVNDSLNAIPEKQKDNVKRIEQIIQFGVKNSLLSDNDAIEQFQSIGYTDEQAKTEVDLLEWENLLQLRELTTNQVKSLFIKYLIDNTQATQILASYGFTQDEIMELIMYWKVQREDKDSMPTKAELEKFLTKGIIDIDEYVNLMRGLGYHDKIIGYYIQEMMQ